MISSGCKFLSGSSFDSQPCYTDDCTTWRRRATDLTAWLTWSSDRGCGLTRLRSLTCCQQINCSTIGDCSFFVAAARVWNELPSVTSSSLAVFRQWLKTELFQKSVGVSHSWHSHLAALLDIVTHFHLLRDSEDTRVFAYGSAIEKDNQQWMNDTSSTWSPEPSVWTSQY